MQYKLRTTSFETLRKRRRVYLASPYSHRDKTVREARYKAVSRVAGEMIEYYSGRKAIFCPIAHTVSIATYSGLDDLDWKEFMDQDLAWLSVCDEVYVLQLDGWKQSKGVKAEIKYAKRHGIEVYYINEQLVFCDAKGVELVRSK